MTSLPEVNKVQSGAGQIQTPGESKIYFGNRAIATKTSNLLSTGFKQRQKKTSETIEVYDQKNKHFFGIKGYVIPKSHYNDPKDMFNPSWENEIKNLKKGAPKKTFLDDVIRQKEK